MTVARVWFSSLILHALFGLDRLVQSLAPTPALEDPTGELVDDLHLAVLDDVVDVALEELLGPQRLLELVHEVLVDVLVEVLDPERLLDPRDAFFGRHDRALGLVDLVVAVALQPTHDARELVVELGRVGWRARDDEWCAGLVDQDRVDLVDDRVVVRRPRLVSKPALHLVLDAG